ncbi:MAG: protein-tyrosine phosphatase family protein [Candidatus Limnocylindrales bacterium]
MQRPSLARLWRPDAFLAALGEIMLELANREGPDLSWIVDDLAVGSRVLPSEWPAIARSRIGAVVDCRAEARDPAQLLENLGIAFLHLPTVDSGAFNLWQVVQGVDWIEQQRAARRRVLVHCQHGKGRSVLVAAAALTRRGMSAEEALALIRARRPIVTPTPGQIARLREYANGGQLPLRLDGG